MVFNRHEILDFGPFVPIIGVGRVGSPFSPFEDSLSWESRQPAANAIDEKPVQVERPVHRTMTYDTPENVDPEEFLRTDVDDTDTRTHWCVASFDNYPWLPDHFSAVRKGCRFTIHCCSHTNY